MQPDLLRQPCEQVATAQKLKNQVQFAFRLKRWTKSQHNHWINWWTRFIYWYTLTNYRPHQMSRMLTARERQHVVLLGRVKTEVSVHCDKTEIFMTQDCDECQIRQTNRN